MTTRHLTIAIDAGEATCEACPRCTGDECDVFAAPRQMCADDDYSRLPACLAAERAHAEAIAQARREVAAEIAVWLHDVAECDPEHPRSCGYAEAAVDIRDRWA